MSARLELLLRQIAHPSLPTIAPGLERVEALLAALGHPERRLPPVVHVAGTNGKGSLIAYLRAGLEAAGKRVHVYTSPHLVRFHERIRLAGRLIGDEELEAVLTRVASAAARIPVTFFEATTAAAFLAFAEHPADVLLLETGMGGRLDATNVVAVPLLTAITPISIDHAEFLGDTLEAIATEKGGILKPGVLCLSAAQPTAAKGALFACARAAKAPLAMAGEEWRWWAEEETLCLQWHGAKRISRYPKPNLEGAHQWPNAMLAAACLEKLGLTQPQIAAGLRSAQWPARLQRLSRLHPVAQAAPLGSHVWLDGGHNPAAAQMLSDWLYSQPPMPTWLIWGMLDSKDKTAFLAPIARQLQGVVAVPVEGGQPCWSPEALAEEAARHGLVEHVAPNVVEAARGIDARQHGAVRLLIAGSLHLAGSVLTLGGAPD